MGSTLIRLLAYVAFCGEPPPTHPCRTKLQQHQQHMILGDNEKELAIANIYIYIYIYIYMIYAFARKPDHFHVQHIGILSDLHPH
jgi:hypothetical protein